MSDITQTCTKCNKKFLVIEPEQEFLKKKELPMPSMCPSCRQARRLEDRGERALYRTTCQKCGSSMITSYDPQKVTSKILCKKCFLEFMDQDNIIKT
jgi:ssDNA-binding Zn-finger/Zn-ribbon topoisomerase 1